MTSSPAVSVLVVDEQPSLARDMAERITLGASAVMGAESISVARQILRHESPEVVLMGLEGDEGVALLTELASMCPRPEMVIHTESASSVTARWASINGLFEVFEKPVAPAVLAQWTERLLRRSRGEPESPVLRRFPEAFGHLFGEGPTSEVFREQVLKAVEFPLMSVLVCGEPGTGKGLVARAVHDLTCPDIPLVRLSSTAPHLDSELLRRLERSGEQGTVLLEEVENLSPHMQSKLLHVLQARLFRSNDASRQQPQHLRLIASSRRTLAQTREMLRPGLYDCLAGFPFELPALRERKADIAQLAQLFLREFCKAHGRPLLKLSSQTVSRLVDYDWPDNARELRAVIERAAVSSTTGTVESVDVGESNGALSIEPTTRRDGRPITLAPPSSGLALVGKRGAFASLPALEQHVISDIFRECQGNLSMAARTLGIPRSTLRDRLKKYGIAQVNVGSSRAASK